MTDIILKLKDIENLFWNITMQMLGYNPNDPKYSNPDNKDMPVRAAWPTNGAPSWKITDDVVFIKANNLDDPISQQRDVQYKGLDTDNSNRLTSYIRAHEIDWTLYGPNSHDNAEKIKNGLYVPSIRFQYNKSNLFLITGIKSPVRLPELYNGQWWERSDFRASFNETVQINNTVPYIKSADILVRKG